MSYLVDPHPTLDGVPCTVYSPFLDLDGSSPNCQCGTRITVEDGLDPRRLVPHELSSRAQFQARLEPLVCPFAPELTVIGVHVDQWDHRALVVCFGNTPMVVGPSHGAALRTIAQLTPARLDHPAEARAWLAEQWNQTASTRAVLEARATTRRRAARVARIASGRQLVTA